VILCLCCGRLAVSLADLLRQAFLGLWSVAVDPGFYFPLAGLDAVGLMLALSLPGVVKRFGLLAGIAVQAIKQPFIGLNEVYPVEPPALRWLVNGDSEVVRSPSC